MTTQLEKYIYSLSDDDKKLIETIPLLDTKIEKLLKFDYRQFHQFIQDHLTQDVLEKFEPEQLERLEQIIKEVKRIRMIMVLDPTNSNVAKAQSQILTVKEAIMKHYGYGVVKGMIVTIYPKFNTITRARWNCLQCGFMDEAANFFFPPLQCIGNKQHPCYHCNGQYTEPIPEYANTRIIQLQDLADDDQLDTLEVYVYGNDIENLGLGDQIQVNGNFHVQQHGKGGRLFTVLHAEGIEFEERQAITISDKDVVSFQRFAKLPNVINRLVSMTAPNIVGNHNDKKLGVLRSLVGGTDPRKGRIHTLFAGNPGTAKTAFTTEIARIPPKSKFVSCQHASGKAITAMIEKSSDGQYIFRLGVVPKASGSICVMDEMQLLPFEDQDAMRSTMQEGWFNLNEVQKEYVDKKNFNEPEDSTIVDQNAEVDTDHIVDPSLARTTELLHNLKEFYDKQQQRQKEKND